MHNITKIDTLYSTETTWHGLETIIDKIDKKSIPNVLHDVREFKIDPSALRDEEGNALDADMIQGMEQDLESWKIIAADLRDNPKTNKIIPLHVPKKGYQIHQNESLFDSMVKACDDVLGDSGYEIKTAGTLGGFKSFIVSIQLKEHQSFSIGKNDKHDQFFNLTSSHDGSLASAIMLSFVRIVCQNTAQFSLQDSQTNGTQQKIKHSQNSIITPEWIEENLNQWLIQSREYQKTLEALKSEKMDLEGFRVFASGVFSDEKSDKLSTQAWNRIGEMESLFIRGKGNSGESEFDAYNAFTEYFTHVDGKNGDKSKRIAKGSFGRGGDWKREAFRALSDRKNLKALLKRGEILLGDRRMVEASKAKAN